MENTGVKTNQGSIELKNYVIEALNEMATMEATNRERGDKPSTGQIVEWVVDLCIQQILKDLISPCQFMEADTPEKRCRLYVNFSRASRGIPGYGFTSVGNLEVRDPTAV